jgi:hypothetical protein
MTLQHLSGILHIDPTNTIEHGSISLGEQPDSVLQRRLCRYQGIAGRLAVVASDFAGRAV